jgi:hypothetical protein
MILQYNDPPMEYDPVKEYDPVASFDILKTVYNFIHNLLSWTIPVI